MKSRLFTALGAFLVCTSFASLTSASLIDRGNGLIYDDVLQITWLADAALATSETFGIDLGPQARGAGTMSWNKTQEWIDAMNASNSGSGYLGFTGWRLPNADVNGDNAIQTCWAIGASACRDNEMGYNYYYNLNGQFGDDLSGNQGPFTNIQSTHTTGEYWTNTLFTADVDYWWKFGFVQGDQNGEFWNTNLYAWAVHDGDIGTVPVPATLYLFGSGLLGLVGVARTRAS